MKAVSSSGHFRRTASRTSAGRVHGLLAAGRPTSGHRRRDAAPRARAIRSAWYSSIVSVRSREYRDVGLSTNPTADTCGSITWIFCSGVTISSCSPSRSNSSSANLVDSSDPRPNASSMTTKRKVRDLGTSRSSLNW